MTRSMIVGLAAALCACDGGGGGGDAGPQDISAAWVYVGPPGDFGWTFAHDQGRLRVETELGVPTVFRENVPETAAQGVIQGLVDEGHDIVFTTSFGYMDATAAAADANPGAFFEHCSGFLLRPNMSNYFGRMYQSRYLTGIVAGRMTRTNVIGTVAAHPIPEVIRHINAIALGARSVNPDVQLHVVWVNAWFDPTNDRRLANDLVALGADVILQDTDSDASIFVAREAGVHAIGYNSDILSLAPETVLTSAVWNWGVYYVDRVRAAREGTWRSQSYWGPISDGIVGLGAWGDAVPASVRDEVEGERMRLVDAAFDVFDGEVRLQDGTVWVPAGVTLTDEEMLSMCQFVEGIVGEIPTTCDPSVCPSGNSCAAP